jgi:hypothetical protein
VQGPEFDGERVGVVARFPVDNLYSALPLDTLDEPVDDEVVVEGVDEQALGCGPCIEPVEHVPVTVGEEPLPIGLCLPERVVCATFVGCIRHVPVVQAAVFAHQFADGGVSVHFVS